MAHQFDVPMLRIELDFAKQALLTALDARHGELKAAIEEGIDRAYQLLPAIVADRVNASVQDAVDRATDDALKIYFEPGNPGYAQILDIVLKTLKIKEKGE